MMMITNERGGGGGGKTNNKPAFQNESSIPSNHDSVLATLLLACRQLGIESYSVGSGFFFSLYGSCKQHPQLPSESTTVL